MVLDKIKAFFLKRSLTHRLKNASREKRFSSLAQAKHVGILCVVDEEDNWKQILSFVEFFQKNEIKISLMGFFDGDIKPLWVVETLSTGICARSEQNFFGIPYGDWVERFVQQPFDFLINLSEPKNMQAQYVSAISKAHCKIGMTSPENLPYCDYLVQIEEGVSLQKRIEQMIHYLKIINPQT